MNGIRLRAAILNDAAALGAMHVASWRETYRGILPDEMLADLSVDSRTAMWTTILGNRDAFGDTAVLVAQDSDDIVGFGSCGRQRDVGLADAGFGGEIGAIYVQRSHQHRGIGRAIMSAMAQALSALGQDAASLWVLRENFPARAFYEGLGGEIVGEKSDELPNVTLVELAYGWRDLAALVG
ncbi:GNAT family N-acetyltransferase [soil metagenome]